MSNEEKKSVSLLDLKAEAVRLIASSECFIIITDDTKRIERRVALTNVNSAFEFIKSLEIIRQGILFPVNNPSTSSIIKS